MSSDITELDHAGRNSNGDSDNTGGRRGCLLRCVPTAGTDLLERLDQAPDKQTTLHSLSSAPASALSAPRPASSNNDWTSILQVSLLTVLTVSVTADNVIVVLSQSEQSPTRPTKDWE